MGMAAGQSMAKLQTEVAAKVLRISNDQGQIAADLLNAAMENVQESLEAMVGGLGDNFDAYA